MPATGSCAQPFQYNLHLHIIITEIYFNIILLHFQTFQVLSSLELHHFTFCMLSLFLSIFHILCPFFFLYLIHYHILRDIRYPFCRVTSATLTPVKFCRKK
jgi:hypothetical protein